MSTHTTAPKNTACGIDGCATGKPAVHVLGEDFPIAPAGTALCAFHSPFDVKPVAEALKVEQFGKMTDQWRGQFEAGEDVWSWGEDDGEFWIECLEGGMTGHYEVAGSLKELFTLARSAYLWADWTRVDITDDFGKKRSVKL